MAKASQRIHYFWHCANKDFNKLVMIGKDYKYFHYGLESGWHNKWSNLRQHALDAVFPQQLDMKKLPDWYINAFHEYKASNFPIFEFTYYAKEELPVPTNKRSLQASEKKQSKIQKTSDEFYDAVSIPSTSETYPEIDMTE